MSYGTTGDLVASRTDTATATAQTTSGITGVDQYRVGEFVLTVSSTTGSGSFTLDVAVQGYKAGSAWTDIARFAQVTTATTRFLHGVGNQVGTGSTTVEEAANALAMTVSTIRPGPMGTQLRAIYTITITGTLSVTWYVKYGVYA